MTFNFKSFDKPSIPDFANAAPNLVNDEYFLCHSATTQNQWTFAAYILDIFVFCVFLLLLILNSNHALVKPRKQLCCKDINNWTLVNMEPYK